MKPLIRPLYRKHPSTKQNIANHEIHASHVEAFNSSIRCADSVYRCKTKNNIYLNNIILSNELD